MSQFQFVHLLTTIDYDNIQRGSLATQLQCTFSNLQMQSGGRVAIDHLTSRNSILCHQLNRFLRGTKTMCSSIANHCFRRQTVETIDWSRFVWRLLLNIGHNLWYSNLKVLYV